MAVFFAWLLMGVVAAVMMAAEGDFSWLKKIGVIIVYIIVIIGIIWFLAVTGWAGVIGTVVIGIGIGLAIETSKH